MKLVLSLLATVVLSSLPSLNITAQEQPAIAPDKKSTADHRKFPILHKKFHSGPEVTQACLSCHTEAAKEVMQSKHWLWESDALGESSARSQLKTPDGKMLGKKHVINNFCIGIAGNEPRCTSCHAGYGYKDSKFNFAREHAVDCLVCHDTTGSYTKYPTAAGHPLYEPKLINNKVIHPPNLSNVALGVGHTSRKTCGACHFFGGGGDGVKHGDLDSSLLEPAKTLDVHMSPQGEDMSCSVCHTTNDHKFAGSRYKFTAKDTKGFDPRREEHGTLSCESCHGTQPHKSKNKSKNIRLNQHVEKVSCQACHIPEFAREKPTKMSWDWSTAGQKTEEHKTKTEKDDKGNVTYHTMKGSFRWEKNVVPEYVFANGNFSYTFLNDKIDPSKVVSINKPQGSYRDPGSRIWPMKVHRGKQAYDSELKHLIVPKLFGPKGSGAYWSDYDWETAIEKGMSSAGLEYSGKYDWVETEMYWPINHMVAPAKDALNCSECHSREGRLAGLKGFYLPGRDRYMILDIAGYIFIGLVTLGVMYHGGRRIYHEEHRKKDNESAEK